MVTREATIEDWDQLLSFFTRVYRTNHPLQNRQFWEWQYGDPIYGRSFICLNEKEEIVGHVGANFGGGMAWIINVFLDEECRGKGILGRLYALARQYYPLAATAANEAGLGLYRNMRWYRYHDLVRYVKINPAIQSPTLEHVCVPVQVNIDAFLTSESHYFQQPTLKGVRLSPTETAFSQEVVGGLRYVDIENIGFAEEQAWELGYHWIDFITSWNDLRCREFEKKGWVLDYKSIVPWRLNPIEPNYFCDITYLSEEPVDKDFIVHRSFSDHGRVGSIL